MGQMRQGRWVTRKSHPDPTYRVLWCENQWQLELAMVTPFYVDESLVYPVFLERTGEEPANTLIIDSVPVGDALSDDWTLWEKA